MRFTEDIERICNYSYSPFPECELPIYTNNMVCTNICNTTEATCEAGYAFLSGAHITAYFGGVPVFSHWCSILYFVYCVCLFTPWRCSIFDLLV